MILTVTLNASVDKRYVISGLKTGEVNRVENAVYSAGGKGLNVSRAAVLAGAQVTATGFAGGHAGAFIEEEAGKQGIIPSFVKVEGESRSCVNIYDTLGHVQTELLEPGFPVSQEDQQAFLGHYKALLRAFMPSWPPWQRMQERRSSWMHPETCLPMPSRQVRPW